MFQGSCLTVRQCRIGGAVAALIRAQPHLSQPSGAVAVAFFRCLNQGPNLAHPINGAPQLRVDVDACCVQARVSEVAMHDFNGHAVGQRVGCRRMPQPVGMQPPEPSRVHQDHEI